MGTNVVEVPSVSIFRVKILSCLYRFREKRSGILLSPLVPTVHSQPWFWSFLSYSHTIFLFVTYSGVVTHNEGKTQAVGV